MPGWMSHGINVCGFRFPMNCDNLRPPSDLVSRSHALAWERPLRRSASLLALSRLATDGTQSVQHACSHAERGNKQCHKSFPCRLHLISASEIGPIGAAATTSRRACSPRTWTWTRCGVVKDVSTRGPWMPRLTRSLDRRWSRQHQIVTRRPSHGADLQIAVRGQDGSS